MRIALAAIAVAGLAAAPASAQQSNAANTAVTSQPTTPPEDASDPVLPITDEDVNATEAGPAPVVQPPLEPEPITANRDRGRFPWGIFGLIGLVGLLGRVRT